MIVLIDNYDSFVYNLACLVGKLGFRHQVYRNDAITLEALEHLQPEKIIISPGPSVPQKAGISIPLIQSFGHKIPILGVCLGHQAIGEAFGGKTIRARKPMHGKSSAIYHSNQGIFKDLPNPFPAARYHSLVTDKASCPKELIIQATTKDGDIMGFQHHQYPIFGIQFHPESILTPDGKQMISHFLQT